MAALQLLIHAPGAPGLRWFGLGPGLRPTRGLWKLQRLFNKHAFWAQARSHTQLRRLLAGSIVLTFFFYAFVNMAMVSGLMPVVGLPLPLVSKGGTSIVTLLIGFGILMSIQTHKRVLPR
jgi:rod shape determining protein RodA